MSVHPSRHRWLPAVVAALAVAGCAGHRPVRDDPYRNSDLDAFLSFLREPGVTRTKVEARLGPPHAAFEGERISAYRLWETKVPRSPATAYFWVTTTEYVTTYTTKCDLLTSKLCDRWMIQLMIEYDDEGGIRRHTTTAPHSGQP